MRSFPQSFVPPLIAFSVCLQLACGHNETTGATDLGETDGNVLCADCTQVKWLTDPNPSFLGPIEQDVAVMFGLRYEVAQPQQGDVLKLETCSHLAGKDEVCSSQALPIREGASAIRYEIEPSNYSVGTNIYRLTLSIERNGEVVSRDVHAIAAQVNACTSCVP